MKVTVVSRKLVKPFTPTPETQKTYHISFMDELNPTMYVPMILYYQSSSTTHDKIIKHLEKSLAGILPLFHPFSGRYAKKDHLVHCHDQGALFVQANVDLHLLQITQPDSQVTVIELNQLLPCEIGAADEESDPMLAVQVNKFTCGGTAIGVQISHRIVDAGSVGIFISAWANAGAREAIRPSFDGPQIFPGKNIPTPEFGTGRTRDNRLYNLSCKRFYFDKNDISRLKERAAATSSRRLSRVQVISGLLTYAFARIDKAREDRFKDLLAVQAVNFRERTVPPLSKHAIGNLVALAFTECSAYQIQNMGFGDFARVMGHDARKTVSDCTTLLSEDGKKFLIDTSVYASQKALSPNVNVVWLTDVTKFRFYEADFGWGNPVWASAANVFIKNHIILMNTKEGDGIEAWVELQDTDMAYFENELRSINLAYSRL